MKSQNDPLSEPPPPPTLGAGTKLDRYELVCKLADGGMASVWIARLHGKHGFEKLVAIKTILPSFVDNEPFRRMFLDEAKIASCIDHTNVARILDLGEQGQILYHVMEWVEGDMLAKLLRLANERPDKPFPTNVFLRIVSDACAGLHAAHELSDIDGTHLQVVHRDVSPQNILVSLEGRAKVIDFGIARANNRLSEKTTFGIIKGKIQYMAPEQARGEPVTRTADIWAIGAMLYHFFAKRHVHTGESEVHVMTKLVTGAPIDPLPDATPKSIRDLIMRSLAFKPSDRISTMADLRNALEAAMIETGNVATTVEVAACVKELAGARVAARRERVRAAIRALDEKAPQPEAPPLLESTPTLPVIRMDDDDDSDVALVGRRSVDAVGTTMSPTNTTNPTNPTNPTNTTSAATIDEAAKETDRRGLRGWMVHAAVVGAAAIVGAGIYANATGRLNMTRSGPTGATAGANTPSTSEASASPSTASSPASLTSLAKRVESAPPPPSTPAKANTNPTSTTTSAAGSPPKLTTTTLAPPANTPTASETTPSAPTVTPPSSPATPSTPTASAPPPPAPSPTMTPTPTVAPPPTPAVDPKHARVTISGVQNEHGVRKRDVQNAVARAQGAMTQCYQGEIARTGRAEGGHGTIRIETDVSGRIVKASATVAFSASVARCIERTVLGAVVAGVDTGEAVASVMVTFEP